jgi:hypothetical protein
LKNTLDFGLHLTHKGNEIYYTFEDAGLRDLGRRKDNGRKELQIKKWLM